MFYEWGTRFFGRVDRVAKLGSVSTKFFHVNFVPLIPLESWFIAEGSIDGDDFTGVRIPLSVKSIGAAWLRVLLVCGTLAGCAWTFSALFFFEARHWLEGPGGGLIVACSSWFGYWITQLCNVATASRARELSELFGETQQPDPPSDGARGGGLPPVQPANGGHSAGDLSAGGASSKRAPSNTMLGLAASARRTQAERIAA